MPDDQETDRDAALRSRQKYTRCSPCPPPGASGHQVVGTLGGMCGHQGLPLSYPESGIWVTRRVPADNSLGVPARVTI